MSETRAKIPAVARADFLASLAGLPLTEAEERTVQWLLSWDQPTLNALADIIRKARAEVPTSNALGATPLRRLR
jgi:hypothetical protein